MQPKHHKLYLALKAALAAVSAGAGIALPADSLAAEGSSAASYSWDISVPSGIGNWQTVGYWGAGKTGTPGSNPVQLGDTATINRSGGGTVSYSTPTGTRTIKNLIIGSAGNATNVLNLSGGDLTVTGISLLQAGGVGVVHGLNISGGHFTGTTLTNNANSNTASSVSVSGTGAVNTTTFNNNASGINRANVNISNGTLTNSGNFNNSGNVSISGAGTLNGGNFINQTGASVTISNTGTLNNSGASGSNAGTIALTAGTFSNSGTFTNSTSNSSLAGGTITNTGTLNISSGTFGNTNTTINQNNGSLNISNGTTNTVGTLNLSGGSVNFTGANSKVSVATDYANSNFGTGNSFNANASISVPGSVVAGGDTKQGLQVNGGAVTTANSVNLDLGNVHVGSSTSQTYAIANTGTTAGSPSIRGAIQTVFTGSNPLNSQLTGSGVTAGNYTTNTGAGALAAGSTTAPLEVNFTASTAGALSGQSVQIVDNFNDKQVLNITGAGWNLASASVTPSSINLGNVHVGGSFGTQNLSVTNTAPTDGYSEKLNASISPTTGSASATGSINQLAAGTTSTALSVGLGGNAHTGSAGVKSGTATISLVSDGDTTTSTGNSGLGTTTLASQTVNVEGQVWRLASANVSPATISLAGVHVGGSFGAQSLTVTNTATADGFSEKLNASISPTTGSASATGTINQLAAGATSTALSVGLDGNAHTGSAGTVSGTVTVSLVSDGETTTTTGNSGLGTTDLASQTVSVSGNVYNYAETALQLNSPPTSSTGITLTANTVGTANDSYTLNFHLEQGSNGGLAKADLSVLNIPNLADLLQGDWDIATGTTDGIVTYVLNDFDSIAGNSSTSVGTQFINISTSSVATYGPRTIQLAWNGTNSDILNGLNLGWTGTIDGTDTWRYINLTINGNVYSNIVPEPGTLWLFGAAGLAAWTSSRRGKVAKQ